MKRIAIISPLILPVPATEGGAVEGLITRLIDDNEKAKHFQIDLFTVGNESEEIKKEFTDIIYVNISSVQKAIDKFSDAFYRRNKLFSARRQIDNELIEKLAISLDQLEKPYDAIIVENQMSTAVKVVEYCIDRFDIPVYFHMHNCVDVYRSPEYIRELVKNGVQFIAVSNYIKEEICSCDKNAVVHVLYNGVDVEKSRRKENNQHIARKFLYAGRIIPEKGVRELVTAFGNFIEQQDIERKDEFRLDIIGFSDRQTKYEKAVQKLSEKYAKNITCVKMLPAEQMPEKFLEYDAVIMPTVIIDAFGLVALETLASGIPLITTNSGALPEVVGDAAVVVDKDHDFVNKLTNAISKVAFDNELIKELSDKGFKRVQNTPSFDIKNYYNGFFEIVNSKENTEKISVIVPVYNVQQYISRCIDSIISQSYPNFEIILVDDGSTDLSGEICDSYAKKDNRIRVFHQKNMGLSAARNTGLDNAKGDLIFFCDSDDYIKSETLENMLKKMHRDHADIVACGMMKVGSQNELFTANEHGVWSGHEAVIQMMRTNNVCTVACNKLYKKELFDGIRFPVDKMHEDEATTYKLLYNSKIVSYTPEAYYQYFIRPDSTMGGKIDERGFFIVEAMEDRERYFENLKEKDLIEHTQIALLDAIKYVYRNSKNDEIKQILLNKYRKKVTVKNVPLVMGLTKAIALVLWKYIRY
ncbi:glycosyltransferase [Butyrivibrio sp. AE3006]|uniref:glycosyltransferase n=1 Tax=Butyrivibrio sp. AE3006 TaxID=1280673 RepID=UPI0004264238|nr:glycosyltransferase [Butyrivibrio sp. AE3006]